jgi:hypothetical protein
VTLCLADSFSSGVVDIIFVVKNIIDFTVIYPEPDEGIYSAGLPWWIMSIHRAQGQEARAESS